MASDAYASKVAEDEALAASKVVPVTHEDNDWNIVMVSNEGDDKPSDSSPAPNEGFYQSMPVSTVHLLQSSFFSRSTG